MWYFQDDSQGTAQDESCVLGIASHPAQMRAGRRLWEKFSRLADIPIEATKPTEEKFA